MPIDLLRLNNTSEGIKNGRDWERLLAIRSDKWTLRLLP